MRAARWNRPSTIALLKQRGANIEARNHAGKTALIIAVELQHIDAVRMLLNCGANVHATSDQGSTALHAAARVGSVEMVWMLLDTNANATLPDQFGRTPWIMAVHHHKDELLRGLLGPDGSKDEFLQALQRDKHPGDVAKHMNMIYQ
jgi:ankyrin repeat protein